MADEKILIVDDDPSVCKVISRVVANKGMRPESAHSGADALLRLEEAIFDLVVLDLNMDDMDGFEVLEAIRGRGEEIPVIILSGNCESHSKLLGLERGADDYVTKPFDPAFLAAKIQALIRRIRGSRRESGIAVGELLYYPSFAKLLRGDEEIPLSATEHSLLRLLMENQGRSFDKEELYRKVWSDADGKTDDNVVMVYISKLRGKIESNPKAPRYILTVRGAGYKFADR